MTKYLIFSIICLILLIMDIIVLPIKGYYPYKTIDELEEELNNLENRVKEIEENERLNRQTDGNRYDTNGVDQTGTKKPTAHMVNR